MISKLCQTCPNQALCSSAIYILSNVSWNLDPESHAKFYGDLENFLLANCQHLRAIKEESE